MKQNIHPTYHQTKVSCACGTNFTVGSTKEEIVVEICSDCHPFYTGKQKLVDTAGMVDRFKERMEKAKKLQEQASKSKKKKQDSEEDSKKTLEDLKDAK